MPEAGSGCRGKQFIEPAFRMDADAREQTILLPDFENSTGEVFDGALKQALAVQLENSISGPAKSIRPRTEGSTHTQLLEGTTTFALAQRTKWPAFTTVASAF